MVRCENVKKYLSGTSNVKCNKTFLLNIGKKQKSLETPSVVEKLKLKVSLTVTIDRRYI